MFADWARRNTRVMWIAGVSLSASSAALLALRLSRAGHSSLSERLGIAVDRDVGTFALLPGEGRDILGVLDDAPDGLHELRDALAHQPPD
jgi:hypothetical protein